MKEGVWTHRYFVMYLFFVSSFFWAGGGGVVVMKFTIKNHLNKKISKMKRKRAIEL